MAYTPPAGGGISVEMADAAYTPPASNAISLDLADTGGFSGTVEYIAAVGGMSLVGYGPAKAVVQHTMPTPVGLLLVGNLPTYKKSRTSALSTPGSLTLTGHAPTTKSTKVSAIGVSGAVSLTVYQPKFFKGVTQLISATGAISLTGNSGLTTRRISSNTIPAGSIVSTTYAPIARIVKPIGATARLTLAGQSALTHKQRVRNKVDSAYFYPNITLEGAGALSLAGYAPSHTLRIRRAITAPCGLMFNVTAQVVGLYTARISAEVASSYTMYGPLRAALVGVYGVNIVDRIVTAIESRYRLPVGASLSSGYSLNQSILARRSIDSAYSMGTNIRVFAAVSVLYSSRALARKAVLSPYGLTTPVRKGVVGYFSIESIAKARAEVTSVYSLPASQVISISVAPYLEWFGRRLGVEEAEVSTSEGDFTWKCTVVLTTKEDYALLRKDQPFAIVIGAERYEFIVDSKELDRAAPASRGMKVLGISPSARLSSPRKAAQTYLWDTVVPARQIAEELVPGIDWQLVDWAIPAYRFAVQDSTPVDALKVLVGAVGGVLESNIDGSLYARSKFPVSVPQYPTVTPAHILVEETDILTVNEAYVSYTTFNRLIITDVSQDFSDSLEWIPDYAEATTGIVRAYLYPWRSAVSLKHTGVSGVYIESPNAGMQSHTEIVEVFEGSGSTEYPIHHIESVEYEAQVVGAIEFDVDSRSFTVSGPAFNSVIRLVYWTRSLDYRVVLPSPRPTQFLLESEPL